MQSQGRLHYGRYRVTGRLGSGGFGVVYLGFDEELHREVAIKVPRPHRMRNPEDVVAYLSEARALARLDHPGIVPIYDVGHCDDGTCYVVSKLIRGQSLASRLRQGPLPPIQSARLIADVALALQHAHERGLVHRDVKPSNILLDEEGRPVVVDFGLARRDEDMGTGPTTAGTPAYMSPEQARGEGHLVDARTDIFSLGVVFYEALTGVKPFRANDPNSLLEQIKNHEPAPLRSCDSTIPEELERICLKALSKRASDRHATAQDLAEDLRHWLAGHPSVRTENVPLVPRGLRAFGAGDADFFLRLLPGPRGRDRLPECIRFWLTRLEETDPTKTCRVGVLYGPSGSGKSSLLRAGIVPRLGCQVLTVVVEAASGETTSRLLRGVRRACPRLPAELGLTEALAALRRDPRLTDGRKLVLLLDQFEQALRSPEAQLVEALRQCDGGRVQCLLSLRDDFWMSLVRFLRELEVPLLEGENSAAVDLFDLRHARAVLADFGRAFGVLPQGTLSAEQERFLDEAVAGLAENEQIFPVRLSLFAEMVKDRPWAPATLHDVGGAEGIGVLFLERAFAAPTAPPQQRAHARAARAVLEALLPEFGSNLRDRVVSEQRLLEVSGYKDRPTEFAELMQILDHRLRLVTPIEPADSPAEAVGPSYQLTHDYLVAPLRQWLTAQRRATLRGRVGLRLAERAAVWSARPEPSYLPSFPEWLAACLLTRPRSWTEPQRRMMRAATRCWVWRLSLLAVLVGACGLAAWELRRGLVEQRDRDLANSVVSRILDAETVELPRILPELEAHRRFAVPRLTAIVHDEVRSHKERLHAALALLPFDPGPAEFLASSALRAEPEHLPLLAAALQPHALDLMDQMWQAAASDDAAAGEQLRSACLVALWAPEDPRWSAIAAATVGNLTAMDPLRAADWARALRPARGWLVGPLTTVAQDPTATPTCRRVATGILADYAAADVPRLTELIVTTDSQSFEALLPPLRRQRDQAVAALSAELRRQPEASWNDPPLDDAWTEPGPDVRSKLEAAQGMLAERFAFCQVLPMQQLASLARELARAGYRPSCFRPFASPEGLLVAAVWLRDGRSWEWIHGASPEAVSQQDRLCRGRGLLPVDVSAYEDSTTRRMVYAALWAAPTPDLTDAALYVAVPHEQHKDHWDPLNRRDFVPRTNLLTVSPEGKRLYSSVRWKLRRSATDYRDGWEHTSEDYQRELRGGWCQADVRWTLSPASDSPSYAGVWWNGTGRVSKDCDGTSLPEHLSRCRQLAAAGYRPGAISIIWNAAERRLQALSVWHYPLPTEESRDLLARRQALAAVALLHLGLREPVGSLLRASSDPRCRGELIQALAATDTDPGPLVAWLADETEVSVRRALLGALADYTPKALGAAMKPLVSHALQLYRCDPDPGVHAAVRFLLQRLGREADLQAVDQAIPPGKPIDDRRWYRTSQGQTLAVLPAAGEFRIGSPGDEPQHRKYQEVPHLVRLDRSFAISMTEVTVEQFLRFRPEHNVLAEYTPDPDCPVTSVSWYDAVAYCRWLSEQEGIPEDQMCYPPVPEIKAGMTLPADFLQRTGYRLPTEAEWEYACRAGTLTGRYFGQSDDLLGRYAWTSNNSRSRASPVARLRPNDFGLFDMLGNAMEWCHDRSRIPDFIPGRARSDRPDTGRVFDRDARVRRGGSFLHQPSDARAAQRDPCTPHISFPFQGFRVARTWK